MKALLSFLVLLSSLAHAQITNVTVSKTVSSITVNWKSDQTLRNEFIKFSYRTGSCDSQSLTLTASSTSSCSQTHSLTISGLPLGTSFCVAPGGFVCASSQDTDVLSPPIQVSTNTTDTPTATITPTATKTVTKTITNTFTFSPTLTATKTITDTFTFSPTKTSTRSATLTATLTATKTITDTFTFSPTRTVTRTVTPTPVPTAVPIASDLKFVTDEFSFVSVVGPSTYTFNLRKNPVSQLAIMPKYLINLTSGSVVSGSSIVNTLEVDRVFVSSFGNFVVSVSGYRVLKFSDPGGFTNGHSITLKIAYFTNEP